jgi:hypothetical protein
VTGKPSIIQRAIVGSQFLAATLEEVLRRELLVQNDLFLKQVPSKEMDRSGYVF